MRRLLAAVPLRVRRPQEAVLRLRDPAVGARVALHPLDPVREVVELPLSRPSCSAAMARTSR